MRYLLPTVLVGMMAGFLMGQAALPKKLTVRQLVVVDDAGKPRIQLRVEKGIAVIGIIGDDGTGNSGIGLRMQDDVPVLIIDQAKHGRAQISPKGLFLKSPKGARAGITLVDESPTMTLNNNKGASVMAIVVDEGPALRINSGEGEVMTAVTKDGPAIICKKKGSVTWRTPQNPKAAP